MHVTIADNGFYFSTRVCSVVVHCGYMGGVVGAWVVLWLSSFKGIGSVLGASLRGVSLL